MNLVGNREQYLEAAYSLRDTLMRMEATEQYWDDADHQTVQTAIMRLRPVMMAALGSTITFSPAAAPPRIWMPRLKDISRQCIAYLEANPDWPPEAQLPEPATWVHSRVWEHVSAHVQTALRSGHAKHWGTVASEAVRFLEDEIRARTVLTARDRRGPSETPSTRRPGPCGWATMRTRLRRGGNSWPAFL